MTIHLNGEQRDVAAGITVGDILEEMQLHPEAVVVEINAAILDRQVVSCHPICDGDHIEIIRFVGGG